MSLSACDTVTSADCVGATRERGDGTRLLTCYRCGANTCAACSSVQPGRIVVGDSTQVRQVRMCDSCLSQEAQDGAARALLRRYHEAGYPETTLDDARAYLASERRYLDRHPNPARSDATASRSRRRPALTS